LDNAFLTTVDKIRDLGESCVL